MKIRRSKAACPRICFYTVLDRFWLVRTYFMNNNENRKKIIEQLCVSQGRGPLILPTCVYFHIKVHKAHALRYKKNHANPMGALGPGRAARSRPPVFLHFISYCKNQMNLGKILYARKRKEKTGKT